MNRITAVIGISLLAGCSGIQPPPVAGYHHSVDTHREKEAERERRLMSPQEKVHTTTIRLAAAEKGRNLTVASYYPGSRYETSVDQLPATTVSGATTVYTHRWQSSQVIFDTGQYSLDKSSLRVKSEMDTFRSNVASSIDELHARLRGLGVNFEITAQYKGCADSTPMRAGGGVVYRGEWGTVDLSGVKTTANSVGTSIRIRPGDYVSNVQLAALRGHSIEQLIHGDMRLSVPTAGYDLQVGQGYGAQYRCASVEFHIQGK